MDTTPTPASQPSDISVKPSSDIMNDPLMEPMNSQTGNKPASEVVSEPSDDFVDLLNSSSTESATAAEIPLDEPSDDFVDLLGSETEAERGEVLVAGVNVEAATDKGVVSSGITDPPSEGKTGSDAGQEVKENAAPVISIGGDLSASNSEKTTISDKFADPLVDLLGDPSPVEAKKPSVATIDLFDDDGSDLFADPQQITSAKQPQKSLFGETDEDLFGEPLGTASNKTTSKEQKEKSVTTKAAFGGPLQDANPTEPSDIFSEEAVASAPSANKTSKASTVKTNGVHSEEETDIFAGGSDFFESELWAHLLLVSRVFDRLFYHSLKEV